MAGLELVENDAEERKSTQSVPPLDFPNLINVDAEEERSRLGRGSGRRRRMIVEMNRIRSADTARERQALIQYDNEFGG